MLKANKDLEWKEINIRNINSNRVFSCNLNFSISLTKDETKNLSTDQLNDRLNRFVFYTIYEGISRVLLSYLNNGLDNVNDYYSVFHNAKEKDLEAHAEIVRELKAFCNIIPTILKREFNK